MKYQYNIAKQNPPTIDYGCDRFTKNNGLCNITSYNENIVMSGYEGKGSCENVETVDVGNGGKYPIRPVLSLYSPRTTAPAMGIKIKR